MLPRWMTAALLLAACAHPPRNSAAVGTPPEAAVPAPPPAATPTADFVRDVRPILEARCQPCHFTGGRMHEALPFDREETIHHLGVKLFTRIKSEDEQRIIGKLLSQGR